MNPAAVARINAAVNECLDQCYVADLPLACLSRYVDRLRSDRSWRAHEIEEFQIAVRRILKQLAGDDGQSKPDPAPQEAPQHHQFTLKVPGSPIEQRRQPGGSSG